MVMEESSKSCYQDDHVSARMMRTTLRHTRAYGREISHGLGLPYESALESNYGGSEDWSGFARKSCLL